MTRYGIGIIGYGGFAEFIRGAWASMPEVDICAAADSNPERNPGDLFFYNDWHSLVNDKSVDIVVIATPPSTHAEMAEECIKAGKHVLIEKPPAMNSDQLENLLNLCKSSDSVVAVDYMLRFNQLVVALKAVADTGILGKLQHVSMENYGADSMLGPDHWFWDKSVSGGILVEHAVHFFDMVSFIWPSRPVRVSAHGVSRTPGMEDKVVATVEHEDGLVATHFHHFYRPGWFERQSFRFAFDLGEIDVEGWVPLTAAVRALTNEETNRQLLNIFPPSEINESAIGHDFVKAGGTEYKVDRMTTFTASLTRPKSEIYADCLRSALEDLLGGIEGKGTPRIALEQVGDSVRIASAAANFADTKGSAELTF